MNKTGAWRTLAVSTAFGIFMLNIANGASWTESRANARAQSSMLYSAADTAVKSFNADAPISQMESLKQLRTILQRCQRLRGCEQARIIEQYEKLVMSSAAKAHLQDDAAATQALLTRSGGHLIGAKLPEMHRSMTLLRGQRLSELIDLNEPVKAALGDWLSSMRPQLIEAYKNYAYMRPLMLPAYQNAELPEALLFGILAKESAGRVHAYSKAGAVGPLQFMPATAMRFGLLTHNGFDTRLDPSAAANANARYIEEQLGKLNNDLELVLAAYNGGEGRVGRLYAEHKQGFWNDAVYQSLPEETRNYVPSVLAAAYLFLHPGEFGLDFPEAIGATAEVKLGNAVSLSELAICLGQTGREEGWFRTLRNLNPAVQPDRRQPAGTAFLIPEAALASYAKQCLSVKFMTQIAGLHEARVPSAASLVGYVVRQGDTLAAIARKAGCSSVGIIATINEIPAPQFAIKPGQRIKLPSCG
jgi:membrane-bound lytic murein transglycosylase D